MKRFILSFALIFAFVIATFAQAPNSFKYQAVARDAMGQVIQNQVIGLRFSLIEGNVNGNSVYSEVHYPTTSDLGVFSLEVGKGIIQGGSMNNADWGNMQYWLRVELDPQGGNNFQMMGISQLLSVPYALHAKTVENADDADADPTNEIQALSFNSNTNILTLSNGGQVDLSSLTGGSGGSDDQNLTLSGTILSIEDGNSINLNVLQDGVNDADADPQNEIQNISFNPNTNTLTLSNGGQVDLSSLAGGSGGSDDQNLTLNGTTLSIEDGNSVDLSSIQDGVNDADANPTNELQNLTLANTMLMISDGNSVDLSIVQDGVNDADADPTNEIQTLSFNSNTNELSIANGNTITIPSGGTDADADPTNEIQTLSQNGLNVTLSNNGGTINVADNDNDSSNEIQTISKNGNTVTLSQNGGSFTDEVNDADADATNELQNLSLNGTTIEISNGNSVDLSPIIPPGGTDDQTLTLNGINLSIEDGNTIDLSVVQDGVDDADNNPTNEIQTLTKVGQTITLSNGGGSILDEVNDLDADPGNELQILSLNGTILDISGVNSSVDLVAVQDGVDDADADPQNELQDMSLQNNVLSLSQSNAQIDLSNFATPWKNVPQTEIIEYVANSPLARISNTNSTQTLNLSTDRINFLDETECRTYLDNGLLNFNREIKVSDDLYLIHPAMALTKDSLLFDDYSDDPFNFSRASYSKDFAYLYDKIGNQEWTGTLEPFQLDLRINTDQAWGNYDAYGIQAITNSDQGIPNDWELYLKTGLGLYMLEEIAEDTLNATLTTPNGFNIGTGPGFGILDETYTRLDKDSLTFDYMVSGGLLSGFSSYGRDQLNMNFQAGALRNSSCMSPFNLCFENDLGGFVNRMDLTHDYMEFVNPNGGYSLTHVGLDSIHLTKYVGLLFPEYVTLKPSVLNFEDFFNKSYLNSRSLTIKEILSSSDIFDRVTLQPDALNMFNSAKWINVDLGTVNGGNAGHLSLWSGTGDFKLVELGHDKLDPFGGSLELFSSNSGAHATAWLRAQNGKGELSLDGPNNLNVYIGNSWGDDRGYMSVYDANGTSSAGMFVTTDDEGAAWADIIYVGENPGNSAKYPFKSRQRDGFGMDIETTDGQHNWEFYVNVDGGLSLWGDGNFKGTFSPVDGAYTQASDKKLKKNITKISTVLPSILKLEPSTYNYIDNKESDPKSIGFLAQDVQKIFPELVTESTDERNKGTLSVNYSGFSVLAIKAIQEQQETIEKQNEKIENLEARLAKLEALISKK